MTDQPPSAHEDLYVELMESANATGKFIIETDESRPDMEFEVERPDKPTRNKIQRAMPDGLLNGIDLPDDVDDIDDISVDDIDLSNVSVKDMTFDEKSTEVWLDAIADHFKHDYYSRSEVRNIFDNLNDEYFISAGSYLLEVGQGMGPVTGFHRE